MYFVGASVPKGGCGVLLAFNNKGKQKIFKKNLDIEKYVNYLDKNEKILLKRAVCSKRAKDVYYPRKEIFDCRNINILINKKFKTTVKYYFDGKNHYLIRSYKVPNSLILYKIDITKNTLIPIPTYIGAQGGEGYLYMEYLMPFDIDGDGVNDLIVSQYGSEWGGFSYLKMKSGYWKYEPVSISAN